MKHPKRLLLKPLLLLTVAAVASIAPVRAQTPQNSPTKTVSPSLDPTVVAYFDEIAQAYKRFSGLRVSASLTTTARTTRTSQENWEWKRPFSFRFRQTSGRAHRLMIGDGNAVFASYNGKKVKYDIPNQAALVFAGGDPFYGELFTGENPMRSFQPNRWTRGEFLGNAVRGGVPCDGVKLWGQAFGKLLFTEETEVWFDAQTRVLRAWKSAITLPKSSKPVVREWRAWKIELNPTFAPDAFLLPEAPPQKEEDEDIYWNKSLQVGGAPFAFSGKDLNGQTQSLEKYRGKVLLLDFWATWCGPCVAELPEVKRVYAKYHKQGFEVLGISLDEGKPENRQFLRDFLKREKMAWPQLHDGKEFEGAIVKKYGVQGIPFVLLIGKNGKIAAINPRGKKLEPAVQKALAAR